MDQDLQKLKEEIEAKKAAEASVAENKPEANVVVAQVSSEPAMAPVDFSTVGKKKEENLPVQSEAESVSAEAGKMVGELFKSAVVHTIQTDDQVKEEVLDTAKQAIKDKTEALKNQTDKEAKAAFFENNQDACTYFGYEEKTTQKSLVKLMAIWSYILNTIYICTIGFFIVSPIVFLCKKIKVIVKNTWVAFLVALLIYALIIMTPIIIGWIQSA